MPGGLPDPRLLSASWRSDLLLGLSAVGAISLEDEIVGITRSLFHDDLSHRELSVLLFGADFDAIHGWMDTVPGSAIRGGGILHRLQHGHDVGAAQAIYEQHGLQGVLVWAQHLAQDTATPTGVPIPVGGERLAEYLVSRGLETPGKAALLVSMNVAEVAGSVLAGAFALRLAGFARDVQRQLKVKRLCERARAAWEAGDMDAVVTRYGAARALADGDPAIEMALGWAYAEVGRPDARSFLAFRAAAEGFSLDERMIPHHGLRLDLRGTAYLLALSQSYQILGQDDLKTAWRGELDRMLRGAMFAFERAGQACDQGPVLSLGEREIEWRPHPLSAAANYYLAARTGFAAPFLPSASDAPRLAELTLAQLERAQALHPTEAGRIERVVERWRAELAPIAIAPPPI